MPRHLTIALLLGACLVTALPVTAAAQCLGDDGLYTGRCWQMLPAKLPTFPPAKLEGLWVPFMDCKPGTPRKATLHLPPLIPGMSGFYFVSGVDLRLTSGPPLWDPAAIWLFFYTRTWSEIDQYSPTRDRYQVWRFLINAEVPPSADLLRLHPKPDPRMDPLIPRCIYQARPSQPVHYFGYVDYAFNCRTSQWSIAFGVTHLCDRFTHNPWCRYPAGGHPSYSYVVVAPSTFMPHSGLPGIKGIVRSEGFRMYRWPHLPLVESEQDVESGIISIDRRACSCGKPQGDNQFIYHRLHANSKMCGSSARSISPFPALWGGSVQISAGHFTGPGYPGPERLYFLADLLFYHDARTKRTRPELFHGVGTQGGLHALLFRPVPGAPLPQSFVDLQNVLRLPVFTHFSGMAGLYVSDILIYLNTY